MRGETICHLADSASGYILVIAGIFICLSKFGIDTRSLSIGLRTTRLKFFSEVTVIRNSEFKNYVLSPADQETRVVTSIVMDIRESLERVEAILKEELPMIHERLCLLLDDPVKGPDYAGVSQIGENSVELSFNLFCKGKDYVMLHSLLFPVVGKFPLHGPDLSFVLPLTGKPDASDTKTQIGRE